MHNRADAKEVGGWKGRRHQYPKGATSATGAIAQGYRETASGSEESDEGGVRDGSLQLPADWQALWGSLYDGGTSRERKEGKAHEST